MIEGQRERVYDREEEHRQAAEERRQEKLDPRIPALGLSPSKIRPILQLVPLIAAGPVSLGWSL